MERTVEADEVDFLETSMQNKLRSMQLEINDEQKEIKITLDELETSMQNNLSNLRASKSAKCSIYKVPDRIRKHKEHCYRPSIISIGPNFCQDPQLQTMQELKWICLQSFLQNPENACPNLGPYINTIKELEDDIRQCYQEQVILSSDHNFIEMIVLDGIFLVQLFKEPIDECPIPNKLKILTLFGRPDLYMLENQIPFFVLQNIFDLAFPEKPTTSLIDLAENFIYTCGIPGSDQVLDAKVSEPLNIEHLLDLCIKRFWLSYKNSKLCEKVSEPSKIEHVVDTLYFRKKILESSDKLPKTAKELTAAGVKFKRSDNPNILCITFDSKKGELHIPYLTVDEYTDAFLRNILHFEQCHYQFEYMSYLSDLFFFIDSLIDSAEDVQILQQNGILKSFLGSDEKTANLFNNITTDIFTQSIHYADVSEKVNAYANRSCNRYVAILRRDYFSHPWAILSFIFAILIFILTVLQTITGFIK